MSSWWRGFELGRFRNLSLADRIPAHKPTQLLRISWAEKSELISEHSAHTSWYAYISYHVHSLCKKRPTWKRRAFCINNYCVGNHIANYLWSLFSLIFHQYLWHESLKFSPVASLLSCCESYEIWLLFKEFNPYFCKIWLILYGETNDKVFTNFNPWDLHYVNFAMRRSTASKGASRRRETPKTE